MSNENSLMFKNFPFLKRLCWEHVLKFDTQTKFRWYACLKRIFAPGYDRTQRPHCAGCSSHGQNKGFPLSKPTHFPNIAFEKNYVSAQKEGVLADSQAKARFLTFVRNDKRCCHFERREKSCSLLSKCQKWDFWGLS